MAGVGPVKQQALRPDVEGRFMQANTSRAGMHARRRGTRAQASEARPTDRSVRRASTTEHDARQGKAPMKAC